MRVTSVLVWVWIVMAGAVDAAPETSLKPVARAEKPTTASIPTLSDFRPTARPAVLEAALVEQLTHQFQAEADPGFQRALASQIGMTTRAFAALSPQAIGLSSRPNMRPNGIVEKAMAQRRARAKGAVCGDPDIQGETVGFVPGRLSACGIKNGVKVRSFSGVTLSQQANKPFWIARQPKRSKHGSTRE